ncbi:MAG TPA: sigma-70 family RNA polymerase sigma factor [Thermoanaerobaculia bacterium]|nr:sigma-70 family RNA polymerase sigma factor [Thermoanaerobaculia bacterium]
MTEIELVQRLKGGDGSAYEEFVRAHGARALGVARRLLGDGPDAEDAVQDAFLSAWKAMGQFDGRAALSTWLHRITINAAIARLKSRTRRRETPMDTFDPDPSGDESGGNVPDPKPDPVAQADLARIVWGEIEELPDEERAVLVLRDVEEFPSKEVAAALGISDAAVRQRLHRARQALAERLQPVLCESRELTCGGRLDLLFDYIDEALERDLRVPVEEHLMACPKCRGFLGLYRETVAAPRHSASQLEPPELPAERRRSLLAAVRRLRDADEASRAPA